MNTDQIRYLTAVNRHHSLRRASEHLFITAQALSQSLSALEKELNLKLIESSRKGTFLTPNGHILLEAGEEFLRIIAELQNSTRNCNDKHLPNADISVLSANGIANTLLPKIISSLYQDYPKIKIKIDHHLTCSEIIEALSQKTVPDEFAFISLYHYKNGILPQLEQYDNIAFEPLVSSRYCVSVPKAHEIYHYNTISLATVFKYPLIIYKDTEDILIPLLSAYGTPQKIISIDDYAVFNQILQENDSYLTLNRLYASYESTLAIDKRKTIPLKEQITIHFGYIHNTEHHFSPLATELLDTVAKYCFHQFGSPEL